MDHPAERREAAARRARLDARDRGLSRASSVTVRVAVGGAAATVAAALVFAQTSPSTDPPAEDAPRPAAHTVVPDPVGSAAGGTVATEGDGGASVAGQAVGSGAGRASRSGATRLQPPATAPAPVSGRHHHATSSPS